MEFIYAGVPLVSAIYFFADDTLMLIKATSSANCLQHILNLYEDVSDQMINKEKTFTLLSPNTVSHVRDEVAAVLGVGHTTKSEKYLGLPVYIGKS